jgi:hypothetical protein
MTAVCISEAHKKRPLDLRVANAVMQHANPAMSWPSHRTLARYAGVADERQVRSAIASLVTSGALSRRPIAELDAESRAKIERKARGQVYQLNMFWALEVFEGARKTMRKEPAPLRLGRERKRTMAVLSDRTGAVRREQDEGRPPNTKRNLSDTEKGASERFQDLTSPREANRYALAKARVD